MTYPWGGFPVQPSDGVKSEYVPLRRFSSHSNGDFALVNLFQITLWTATIEQKTYSDFCSSGSHSL